MPYRPEWLPMPGRGVTPDVAELIVQYYCDDLGELCAGMNLQLRTCSRISGTLMTHIYSAESILTGWRWYFYEFNVAYICESRAGSHYYVRVVIDKESGAIRWEDRSGLFGEPTTLVHRNWPGFDILTWKEPPGIAGWALDAPDALVTARDPSAQQYDLPERGVTENEPSRRIGTVPDLRRG